jgi:hypothetical protein
VRAHFRTIAVLDQNDDQILLCEFREPVFSGLFIRKRLRLSTEEAVKKDAKGFAVMTTGERLTRVPYTL